MEKSSRSYSLVRTLILGSATLAIVGVLFAIYQSISGGPAVRSRALEATADRASLPEPTTTRADSGVDVGSDVRLGGGAQGRLSLYDRGSDRPTAVLSHRAWEPVPKTDNQFQVTEPRVEMRTPGGQLVEIQARMGLIQLKMHDGDRPDLRHGRLMGDVLIKIDRLDDEQRAALPPEERDHPGPDRLIIVELDDVDFDRDFARLTTTGRFRVAAAEASIEGRGLTLRYNEVDSSVEYLETGSDGRIAVRGLGGVFKVGLPGIEESAQPTTAPTESGGGAAQPSPLSTQDSALSTQLSPQVGDDGIPVLAIDAGAPAHPAIAYHAAFTGQVHVGEIKDGQPAGELVAEILEVFFAFGQAERDAARARTAPASAPATEPTEPGEPDADELSVTWSGPLVIKRLTGQTTTAQAEPPVGPNELRVVATGDEVRVTQGDRSVSCQKLVYDRGAGRHHLFGRPDKPATIAADGGYTQGPEIELDLEGNTARVVGPGRMSDTGVERARLGLESPEVGPRPGVDIRFEGEVNVTFATAQTDSPDAASADQVGESHRYLKSATFLGGVSMQQGADLIRGDRVELTFDPPRKGGAFEDSIRRLQAETGVELVHGDESVRCARIDVEMSPDHSGRVSPRVARAYGQVSATQGARSITAGDRMLVVLGSFRVEPEPWDQGRAWLEAMRRGVDPQQVNWEEQRAKYEAREQFRPGVVRLDAFGGVKVDDPHQSLRLSADTLECTFRDGRRIDQALVTGNDASPAHVELDEFAITARVVELDVGKESADVPGRGRLSFKSRRDLDGRTLDEPMLAVVTWSQRLTYRGAINQAVVTGNVQARTEESSFDCGELTILFAQTDPTLASAPKAAPDTPIDWWVFGPVVDRIDNLFAEKRDESLIEGDFNKEPIYLAATGGAVALTSKVEPPTGRVLSRGRIAGPKILVDLRTEAMTVEGAGSLLIEDYDLPTESDRAAPPEAERRSPFGGMGVSSPSQTFISWAGDMSYYFGKRAAFFERGVEMAHRSGTEILLGRELVGEATYSAVVEAGIREGRQASLTCDGLVVQFDDRAEDGDRGSAGAGDMSGYELVLFEATGKVHFQDAGITVLAHRVSYNALRSWLTIHGSAGGEATLYDQRNGYREWKAEVIDWNRATGEIHAPKATHVGR